MKVLSEKPLSLPEVKEILDSLRSDEELTYIESRVLQFADSLKLLDPESARKLKEELVNLGVDEKIAIKIVEILPRNKDDLRAIFYTYNLDDELAQKILETVKAYL